jgi:hypothetical protein
MAKSSTSHPAEPTTHNHILLADDGGHLKSSKTIDDVIRNL